MEGRVDLGKLPQNPYETIIYDRAEKRWKPWILVACFASPIVLWPIWDWFVAAAMPELATGLIIAMQFGMILSVSDRLPTWLAQRELDQARRNNEIPVWAPRPAPTPAPPRPPYVSDISGEFSLRYYPENKRLEIEHLSEGPLDVPEFVRSAFARMRMLAVVQDGLSPSQRTFLFQRIDLRACLAADGRDPAASLIRDTPHDQLFRMILEEAKSKPGWTS